MEPRICYVLGGSLQDQVERRKRSGEQPLSEFNTFVRRNGASLASTIEVPRIARRLGSGTIDRAALALVLRSRRAEYDVLVASGEDVGIPLALATLGLRCPPPVWIVLHGSYCEGWKFAALAPLLRRAGHVQFLCLADSLRTRMIEVHGFAPQRCHNAGYGVDTDFFTQQEDATLPLVLSAGCAHRDYELLVQAARGLDTTVRIAADSLWRPTGAGVDHAGLPGNVEVRSAGDYPALRALYAAASFVVVPLHQARHACGYAVIAEAMAMGRAVIATRTEAPSDLMVENETGLYVAPGDAAGLRSAMDRLLADPWLARRMGTAGAARMHGSFGLDAYCGRIEALVAA